MDNRQPRRSGQSATAQHSDDNYTPLTNLPNKAALRQLYGESLQDKLRNAIAQLGMIAPAVIEIGVLHQFDGARVSDVKTGFCLLNKSNAIVGDFDSGVDIEVTQQRTTRMRIAGGV